MPDTIALGETVLDLAAGTLRRGGALVPLRAKSFRLLVELARQRGRVVPKDELLDRVWPGIHVTEDSLTQAVRDIRRALGDDGTILRTVARRGFLLVPSEPSPGPAAGPAPPQRPRIAVLPLRDLSGDPAAAPLLEGLHEEITAGLARFRSLVVLARHSAVAVAAQGLPLPDLAARLGADLLVEGSARRQGEGLRLTLALDDARSGAVLWTESVEVAGEGLLDLPDTIPRRIAARVSGAAEADAARAALTRPGNLTAFEHLARGKALFRSYEPGVNERAAEHFRAAIAADPAFGPAHAYLAMTEMALADYALAPRAIKERALADVTRAVELAPDDSRCRSFLSYMQGWLGQHEAGEVSARLAVGLNPSDPDAHHALALALLERGRHAESLDAFAAAKALNPLWPAFYDHNHSAALFHLGRYEEAAEMLLGLPRLPPRARMRLAATLALLGDEDAARRQAAQARAQAPGLDFVAAARIGYARERPEDLDQLADGIARALALLA